MNKSLIENNVLFAEIRKLRSGSLKLFLAVDKFYKSTPISRC
jgi:hypothetical protein